MIYTLFWLKTSYEWMGTKGTDRKVILNDDKRQRDRRYKCFETHS